MKSRQLSFFLTLAASARSSILDSRRRIDGAPFASAFHHPPAATTRRTRLRPERRDRRAGGGGGGGGNGDDDDDESSKRTSRTLLLPPRYRRRRRREDARFRSTPTDEIAEGVEDEARSEASGEIAASDARRRRSAAPPPRNVAILLPESSSAVDHHDDDDDVEDYLWRVDATRALEEASIRLDLPILDREHLAGDAAEEVDDAEEEEEDRRRHSHYLTAVSYPRAGSYALALVHRADDGGDKRRRRNGGRNNGKRKKKTKLSEPLFVDLCPPTDTKLGYRLKKNPSGSGELLIKALGLNNVKKALAAARTNDDDNDGDIVVYDLTAGLARDSLVILSSLLAAKSRARLHLAERDPTVAALLTDAVRRLDLLAAAADGKGARDGDDVARRTRESLSVEEGDGIDVLERLATASSSTESNRAVPYPPDVIYLDPMFPPRRKKTSAVKKDMAALHSLLGTASGSEGAMTMSEEERDDDDDDAGASRPPSREEEERTLLLAACRSGAGRVVVKRPVGAELLGLSTDSRGRSDGDDGGFPDDDVSDVPKPSYDVRGSVNRFDVYVLR